MMNKYGKFMSIFWLVIGIVITLFVTYKVATEGLERWVFMYVFAALSFLNYFFRRFLLKRAEKHIQYMEEKQQNK